MTTYFPPKKNTAFVIEIALVSQANTKIMQSSPTIAAGDFKVSIDGGALANLATLPVVTPAASKLIKVDLSAAEMNGDNITLVCSDAAGAEWCDLIMNLQTTARQIDDLAYPTVAGRSLDVTATGAAGIDWANVENPTTALNLSATNIDVDQVVASVSGAVGSVTGNVGGNVTGSVGSVTGAVGSVTAGVTVTTNNDKTGYSLTTAPLDAAGVRGAVGLATANLDTQLDALPTAAENADQVWDELLSGHAISGSTGAGLSAASSAGDPWSTLLPGAYGAGTAGNQIAAIKTKTDTIPASPAAVGSAMTLTSGERNAIALAALLYDWNGITGEASYSSLNALRFLRNHWTALLGILSVYKENGSTLAWSGTLATSDSGDPIIGMTPT